MKKLISLALAILMLTASCALADSFYEDFMLLSENSGTQAQEAFTFHFPDAVIDYALLDYDDSRFEWDIFYHRDLVLGCAEVDAETYEVLGTEEFENLPEDALNAAQIIAALQALKGELAISELELEYDDGMLLYEGEVGLSDRYYDFEMTLDGQIIEWERD